MSGFLTLSVSVSSLGGPGGNQTKRIPRIREHSSPTDLLPPEQRGNKTRLGTESV